MWIFRVGLLWVVLVVGLYACTQPVPPLPKTEGQKESTHHVESMREYVGEPSETPDFLVRDWPECQPGRKKKCYSGPEITLGVGVCKSGLRTCTDEGLWGECEGEVTPGKEVCNALDDDCNGQTDEPCPCIPGFEKACGWRIGECKQGKAICKADGSGWGVCVGDVGPEKETCNGKDDDCNGEIDEKLTRSCYTGPAGTADVGECLSGTQSCSGGIWGSCHQDVGPVVEKCNDKDDDCDGSIDEDFPDKGDSCELGVGACKRVGKQVCSSKGGLVCQAVAGQPQAEICDGIDNDCDGKIDVRSCYPQGIAGCVEKAGKWSCIGACQLGNQSCQQGVWGACVFAKTPAKDDRCGDNVDNDCDGKTDEGCCPPNKKIYQWKNAPFAHQQTKFSSDLKLVLITSGKSQHLYSISGQYVRRVHTTAQQSYLRGIFHPNDKSIITFGEKWLEEVDVQTGKVIRKVPLVAGLVHFARFPDVDSSGTYIAVAGYSPFAKVTIWRYADLKVVHTIDYKQDDVSCLRFSPSGKQIVICEQKSHVVKVWSVPQWKLLHTLQYKAPVFGVDFHPKKDILLIHNPEIDSNGESVVEFYDLVSSKKLSMKIKGDFKRVSYFRYSPNGRWIAGVGMDSVRATSFFDANTGKKLFTTPPHRGFWGITHGWLNGRWSKDSDSFAMGVISEAIYLWGCQ
tara:strand:+ start:218 stop:2263 length:2046 start_codon:yes stop_codon:yes gene_type:complete